VAGSILVETGWPAKPLSPNARPHHLAKASAKKKAFNEAWGATQEVKGRDWKAPQDGRFNITIEAFPAVWRGRDDDNLVSSVKAHLDGIAKALGVNDSRFNAPVIDWHTPQREFRFPRGRLVFHVEPLADSQPADLSGPEGRRARALNAPVTGVRARPSTTTRRGHE
jgi:crossover junction endodeoxyribonuclease RusA